MPRIPTLAGGVDAAHVRSAVLGEHLIATFPLPPLTRATDVFFAEQPLGMERLGEAMLGRANRDDHTLTTLTARAELAAASEAGVNLVLDITQPEHVPAPAALAQLGRDHDVHVVTAAAAAPSLPPLRGRLGERKAGIILLDAGAPGSGPASPPAGPGEPADAVGHGARALQDAAAPAWEAALATGAPVLARCHGDAEAGLRLAAQAGDAGLQPGRLAVSNASDWAGDTALLIRLAEAGTALHFTRLGRVPSVYTRVSDHEVAAAIAALVAAGHGGRVLLGTGLDRKHAGVSHGGNGMAFLQRQFLPYLGFLGVEPGAAAALTAANAAAFLSWTEPTA